MRQNTKVPLSYDLEVQRQLNVHSQRHTLAIIIGPPPDENTPINTASGCILQLSGRPYLLTAEHVLKVFEERKATNTSVRWQICSPEGSEHYVVFEPLSRVSARTSSHDCVAIELTDAETETLRTPVCTATNGWPPPVPQPGDLISLAGYPRLYRRQSGAVVEFGALTATFEVTAGGEYHCVAQWDRNHIVNTTESAIPEYGSDLGGMSGGPVFLVRQLSYPICGLITDFHSTWELLRIAHLSALPIQESGPAAG